MISSIPEILIHAVVSSCMFVSKVSQWVSAWSKSYGWAVCLYTEERIGIYKFVSDGMCFEKTAYVEEVAKPKWCII